MPTTPNYKETTLEGSQYTRCNQVLINNPLGEAPTIQFMEQDIMTLSGRTIQQYSGMLSCTFDPENTEHLLLYSKLNDLYTILREARDAEIVV